ncbi:MAG: RNA methyltransferase [Clostridiales bacterium]|nr:RNA methyltransferase [Clostridiales bacterium]
MHYPVLNKKGETVNTSLTNLDLHDIARAAAVYDVRRFYLVQPLEGQRDLMERLLSYWREGFGVKYNPQRSEALRRAALAGSLEEAEAEITRESGGPPVLVATSARVTTGFTGYEEMSKIMRERGGAYLILFGTGWGLADAVMQKADYTLRPVYGRSSYNHLSVRSAASIVLDRLLGEKFSPL